MSQGFDNWQQGDNNSYRSVSYILPREATRSQCSICQKSSGSRRLVSTEGARLDAPSNERRSHEGRGAAEWLDALYLLRLRIHAIVHLLTY